MHLHYIKKHSSLSLIAVKFGPSIVFPVHKSIQICLISKTKHKPVSMKDLYLRMVLGKSNSRDLSSIIIYAKFYKLFLSWFKVRNHEYTFHRIMFLSSFWGICLEETHTFCDSAITLCLYVVDGVRFWNRLISLSPANLYGVR